MRYDPKISATGLMEDAYRGHITAPRLFNMPKGKALIC
jgi:hypothetical protein